MTIDVEAHAEAQMKAFDALYADPEALKAAIKADMEWYNALMAEHGPLHEIHRRMIEAAEAMGEDDAVPGVCEPEQP